MSSPSMVSVARWKPDARERLRSAALELFSERGFADTTVPQITERAGLTTRTFFRYYADKREVLFAHEDDARTQARAAVEQAPRELSTAGFVAWGLQLMATRFEGQRDEMRMIHALIDSDASLQERALRKREMLNSLFGEALQSRGLSEQQARLLAEATVSALYIALDQWLKPDSDTSIDALALDGLAALREDLDGIDTVHRPALRRGRPTL